MCGFDLGASIPTPGIPKATAQESMEMRFCGHSWWGAKVRGRAPLLTLCAISITASQIGSRSCGD
jgi:hypothetical protein